MTSDDPQAVFSLESPDLEETGVVDGGESDSDDDLRENDQNSPSKSSLAMVSIVSGTTTTSSLGTVTVALPAGSAVPITVIPVDSNPKWHRMTEIVNQRPAIDDSRRLFQRLWTDEDEIELLRGFLDYMTIHRGKSSHPPDTAPFYEQIKSKLQLDFNKNQLVEKLRRLKKKYRNVMSKISSGKEVTFKSSHDQATFETSRKIWNQNGKIIGYEDNNNNVMDFEENHHHGNNNNSNGSNYSPNLELNSENGIEKSSNLGSKKRSRSRIGKIEEDNNKPDVQILNETGIGRNLEETVKNCVSSVMKEMMNGTTSMMMAAMGGFTRPMNFGFGGDKTESDERWRKQQILELEVYSRRLGLVQEEIRETLHELKDDNK